MNDYYLNEIERLKREVEDCSRRNAADADRIAEAVKALERIDSKAMLSRKTDNRMWLAELFVDISAIADNTIRNIRKDGQ